jgi:hypothetical protein
MKDPADASVSINRLSRELNDLLAFAGSPDYKRIAEVATEMRAQANQVRIWAFEKEVHRRAG